MVKTFCALFIFVFSLSGATITNLVIGSASNDGTGDTLKVAFTKINSNFAYVVSLMGTTNKVDTSNGYATNLTVKTALVLPQVDPNSILTTGPTNTVASTGYSITSLLSLISARQPIQGLRLSFEGDSIVSQTLPTWPNYIGTYSPYFGRALYVTNYGLSGDRVASMPGEYATQAHLNRPTSTNEEAWFFLHGGGNDIADGTSVATIYQYLKNLWQAARLDGYKVVAVHVTPRNDFTLYQATNAVAVVALNQLIDSDPSLYDFKVAADVVMSTTSDTNLFYDGTHPTVAGANVIARTIDETIFGIPIDVEPAGALGTNGVGWNLRLNRNGGNVTIGSTNTGAKLAVSRTFIAPTTGGISANTIAILSDNNAANAIADLTLLGRSSQSTAINFGNETTETFATIRGNFAGGTNAGINFKIAGVNYAHIDNVGIRGPHASADSSPGITTNIVTTTAVTFTIKNGLITAVTQ